MVFGAATVDVSRPESFAIKGVLLPLTLLDIRSVDYELIQRELAAKVEAAPSFFSGNPVVVSIEGLEDVDEPFLENILALCEQLRFRLVGVKGDGDLVGKFSEHRQLAHFPAGRARPLSDEPIKGAVKGPSNQNALNIAPLLEEVSAVIPTKTIHTPIRSGQQIFSDGDLVVLAPVSAGAELLAVGNIHVYAPLRGRALAGVKGDESARIFCMSQEAELVSIAGHFMIDENLRKANWKSAIQVFFNGSELCVEPILD